VFTGDAGQGNADASMATQVEGQAHTPKACDAFGPLQVALLAAAPPVHELGPKIEHHPRFPARANVGFLQVIDRNRAQ
ncbi:hypothetical protein KQH89_11830, partial [Vibrio cholerae]|nr:hypothetical protein [Vibrio cholerae]